jgi:peroxiredoxin
MDIALILLIFWGVGRYQSRHLLDDATLAPDFALTDVSGQTHRLSDYRGKAVLLVFWAPWCTVCHLEADNWSRVQSWRDDVQLLAVAMSFESRAAVAEFVGDAPYPVLLGTDAIGAAYRVNSYPTHYLIDPEGRVAWQGVGYTTTVGLWMRVVASG